MIKDAKGGPFTWVLDRYIRRKVQGAFRGVWRRGSFPSSEGGLIAYLNHSSFWDGFMAHQIGQLAGWNAYAMMEEENLAKYRFHTRIGAFGVHRGDAKSALASIRYAKEVLQRPNAAVFIFPEGEIHAGQGPLGPLQRGVEVIARTAKVRCVPIAVRYAFLEHEHPDVLLEVGTPHAAGPLEIFEQGLAETYSRVMSARSLEGFTRVLAGRSGVQDRWDAVRQLPAHTTATSGAVER
jgi:1-acyl-sn-glycerol-3-phosphate acyltransferase